jgi:AraC-like DNA-binding protein
MAINLTLSCSEANKSTSFLVRRYLFLNSEGKTGTYCDKHIPEGSCTLIFNFSGEVNMSNNHTDSQKLPPYFLTLPYLGPVNIKVILPCDTFGVVCKTSVFSAFFNIPLDKAKTPSFRTINDIIPQKLYLELKNINEQQARIQIFENFITEIEKGKEYKPDSVDIAYEHIFDSNGLVQINDLISELDINSRTFRRNFQHRVGISAKSLCRIVRAAHILNALKESNSIDFQNIVYSGKYFDQPHFVNDFRKFIGESPGTFFHRDLRLVKLFSGI